MSNEPAPPFAVERRPDPDAATALAATATAFLSWYFHVTCGACRRAAYVNHVPFLLDGWAEPRCARSWRRSAVRCGGTRLAPVELVSRLDVQTGDGPIRRVRLVGDELG